MKSLYALTLFVSAALVFIVQPLAGRMLLPHLGGTAVVWNIALVFFQATLLAGYLYAHFASTWLGTRRHMIAHMVLVGLAALTLPVAFDTQTLGTGESPVAWLAKALVLGIGLPFLVVSATAPMLQRWYSTTDAEDAADPYYLYAASNAGSLVGLLAYPLVFEVLLPVSSQSITWSLGYGGLGLLLLATIFATWNHVEAPARNEGLRSEPIGWKRRLLWIAYAFIPSSLLLGTTNRITSDLAAVPLLWVAPLAAYIISFVLVFSKRRPSQLHATWACAISLNAGVVLLASRSVTPMWLIAAIHVVALFFTSVAYHGALVEDRPKADRLTEFYIWMSLGGVLGGAFNALLAPMLFTVMLEHALIVGVALAWLPGALKSPGTRGTTVLGLLALALVGLGFLVVGTGPNAVPLSPALVAVAGLPTVAFAFKPRLAGLIGAIAALSFSTRLVDGDVVHLMRSNLGAYALIEKVNDVSRFHVLFHGNTNHGSQSTNPELSPLPLAYYHPSTPIGQLLTKRAAAGKHDRIAVVGLGAGALAAYARDGATMRFIEIDPAVVAISSDPAHFTYLSECGEACDVVVGDGRVELAGEDATYDVIVLDAYNSDSIPVHLVTRDALEIYLDRLAPGGVLAFHTTNRHIDVRQIVINIAAAEKLAWRVQWSWVRKPHLMKLQVETAEYVIVARDEAHFGEIATDPRWEKLPPDDGPVWTDDFTNIFPYYRWN